MKFQIKPLSPLIKLSIAFAFVGLLVIFAIHWIYANKEVIPPVTEHTLEQGQLVWTIDAYPAKVLKPNTFTIMLTDTAGVPLEGAKLDIKLVMVSMVCGDCEFKLSEIAPGKYVGEGMPLMAGLWKAVLNIQADDQTTIVERRLDAVF